MRLSEKTKEQILSVLKKYLSKDQHVKIYLFGSRVHDHLKGGDINLAIVFKEESLAHKLAALDYVLLADLKRQSAIGDQKIDLKIICESDLNKPFYMHALNQAVLLFESVK